MPISHIHLRDYRNFTYLNLDLHPSLNIIIGNNGAGKTNILESLIVASNTKSFRTLNDLDLILKGKESALIDIKGDNDFRNVISKKGKYLSINKKPVSKMSDYIGQLNCILFKPSDLELFNQNSKERRRIFDIEIGKIDRSYLYSLLTYNKLVKDKNHLLKQETIDSTYLEILEESMIPHIHSIILKRQNFIDFINEHIEEEYYQLANQKDEIQIFYKRCFEIDKFIIKDELNKNHSKDMLYRCTTSGPHRDDIIFKFNGCPIESIASQGQKRMVMIAFKLALIKYIESVSNKTPIILFDDILSELDIDNRKRLIDKIKNIGQTLITTTDVEGLNIDCPCKVIEIKKGALYGVNDYKTR